MFTLNEFNVAIEAMAKSQASAKRSIERCIVMAVWGSIVGIDGQPSADMANTVLRNLRKGARKAAVAETMEALGNLNYSSGAFTAFAAGKEYTEEYAAEVKVAAASWETFKKAGAAQSVVDVAEAIEALAAKLTKLGTKDKLARGSLLVKLQAFSAAIQSEIVLEDVEATQG